MIAVVVKECVMGILLQHAGLDLLCWPLTNRMSAWLLVVCTLCQRLLHHGKVESGLAPASWLPHDGSSHEGQKTRGRTLNACKPCAASNIIYTTPRIQHASMNAASTNNPTCNKKEAS